MELEIPNTQPDCILPECDTFYELHMWIKENVVAAKYDDGSGLDPETETETEWYDQDGAAVIFTDVLTLLRYIASPQSGGTKAQYIAAQQALVNYEM